MRRILCVGMPFGRFFREFASALENAGCAVHRVTFDAGDYTETRSGNRIAFRGRREDWSHFIDATLRRYNIDSVITFNDARYREAGALAAAERLGIHRYVLEHGYLRPHWITFERDGVNAHSKLPRDIGYYRHLNMPAPAQTSFPFRLRGIVINTLAHYALAIAGSPIFGYETGYYGDSVRSQARGYTLEFMRRHFRSRHYENVMIGNLQAGVGKIHLCLLQKPGDAQLLTHSKFGGNLSYLSKVLQSFAKCAPTHDRLIIKQHPLDYGKERCDLFVAHLARELGIADRLAFVRNFSIELIMPLVASAVTINSTAGLACVIGGKPVICLGDAIYNFAGLTCQMTLDEFWAAGEAADPQDVACFINYLKATSQFCGGFETAPARKVLIPALVQAIMQDSLAQHTEASFDQPLDAPPCWQIPGYADVG